MLSLVGRKSTAVWCFAIAIVTWVSLAVVIVMLLVDPAKKLIGNPIFTFGIAVAITATLGGIIVLCYIAIVARLDARYEPRKTYILRGDDITGEIRPSVYRATANYDETVETKRKLATMQLAEVRQIHARVTSRHG